jgi:hypothetical protein
MTAFSGIPLPVARCPFPVFSSCWWLVAGGWRHATSHCDVA